MNAQISASEYKWTSLTGKYTLPLSDQKLAANSKKNHFSHIISPNGNSERKRAENKQFEEKRRGVVGYHNHLFPIRENYKRAATYTCTLAAQMVRLATLFVPASSDNLCTHVSCHSYTSVTHQLHPSSRALYLPIASCQLHHKIQPPKLISDTIPIFTQLSDFISMENLTLPPTTFTTNTTTTLYNNQEQTSTNTTLYNQEETLTLGNQQRPNMVNEAHSYVPSLAMPHSNFHNTSPYLQSNNQNMQVPYSHLYGHAVPVVFPRYPYQVERSGTVNETPNSFPDRLLSNGNVGHTVQRTISIPPAGLSEFQKPRRSNPSTTNSSRSKTKRKMGKCAASSYGSNGDQDLYTISTPDNKKLRVLLQKDLSSSDVGTVGRIVLPKREAERNLPSLSDKEGIQLVIRDVCSTRQWQMRYRFWSNLKGRMHLLDQIGDFVGQNGLEIGDCLTIYEDESKNLYFSIMKAEKPAQQPLNEPRNACYSNSSIQFTEGATDEDTSSLQILMEELKHTDLETNSLRSLIQTLLHQPNNSS